MLVALGAAVVPTRSVVAAGPRKFRMFSLGYFQTMENAVSYDTYLASLEDRFKQLELLYSDNTPNVVLLPEALGLTTWLIGARGQQARQDGNTAESAIASLASTYAPQVSYYQSRCQTTAARALVLALTDTSWRAFGESLSALAKKYGTYIVATHDISIPQKVTDPIKVELLGDPEIATGYAYEATTCEPYNAAFVFGPEGQMFDPAGTMTIGKQDSQILGWVPKGYLVPIERDQSVGLSLASPSPAAIRPVDIGFTKLGIFTSKDAWMSDLPNRHDVDGAEIFVQPEAGPWAGWSESGVENWQQDGIMRAFWSYTQKLPQIRWGAVTNLIGNFHTLPFDGTPTIATDAPDFRPEDKGEVNARHFLLGQKVTHGIVARSKWFAPDPPPDVKFGDIKGRREFLQAEGAKRAPEGEMENDYVPDAFVWTDVTLPRIREPVARLQRGPFDPSVRIDASDAAQWEPSISVMGDGRLVAAWTGLEGGDEDALVSVREDGVWSPPVSMVSEEDRPDDQQDNQYGAVVTASGNGVFTGWLDFRNQSWDVHAAAFDPEASAVTSEQRVDKSPSSAEGFPNENLHNDVAISARKNTIFAAWSDLRGRNVDRDIRVALLGAGDQDEGWSGDALVSGPDRVDQFHPAMASRGRALTLVWQDHRRGDADIRFAQAQGRGLIGFTRPGRVDDGPPDADAFTPAVALAKKRSLVVWSDDRSGVYQIRASISGPLGFSKSVEVDRSRREQTYPAVINVGPGRWVAAWTDHRAGDTDVVLCRIESRKGRLFPGPVMRVDDTDEDQARLPALAFDGSRVWIAWENMEASIEQIRVTSAPVSKLF